MREYSLDEVRSALSYLNEDDRDTWVRAALMLKSSFGDDAFYIWDEWSERSDKYQIRAARNVWKSAKVGKLTVGTLIKDARAKGWQPGPAQDETDQQRAERAQRKLRHAEMAARELEEQALYHQAIAEHCEQIWSRLYTTGASKYLGTKKINAHGILFAREAFLSVVYKDRIATETISEPAAIRKFLDDANAIQYELRPFSFRHIKRGAFAVPMRDIDGKLWALQLIWPTGKKSFFYNQRKTGLMHIIGSIGTDHANGIAVICICEGYATGGSIHAATGLTVIVAFDAGNLISVAQAVRAQYPSAKILFTADNDSATEGNPGVTKATEAAQAIGAMVCAPYFPIRQVAN